MAQVKLNLRELSVPEKVQFARQIVTAMTGNANFTTPVPALAAVTTSINATEAAFNKAQTARDDAKTKTGLQNDALKTLDLLLSQLANYVEGTSKGEPVIINSAGMSVRDKAAPVGDMPAPGDMSATAGDKEGEIDLVWDAVRGAKSYVLQLSEETATAWKHAGVSVKSMFTVEDLTQGKKYWFRAAAVGTAGQGAWSDLAVKIAP